MSVQFFGAIDRTKDGKISSEYPAFTFPRQLDNAREEIGMKTRLLQSGSVDPASEGEYRAKLEREQERLDSIEKSTPNLNDVEKDLCAKAYKDLTDGVKGTMPSHSDIHRNFVDAHEEHRRNSTACIKVAGKTAELAEQNGIRVSDGGEMSRKDASRLAKIIGHVIGKNTNMERLRKEGFVGIPRYAR